MRRRSFAISFVLTALAAGAARAQEPVALTLGRAVAVAADTAPAVQLAALRASEAEQRVREVRGALLPNLSAAVAEDRRTSNLETFGFSLPLPPGQSIPSAYSTSSTTA